MLHLLALYIANIYDLILDLIYCGFFKQKNVEQAEKIPSYTSSQSCRYFILESIFRNVQLDSLHNFLDVGCGQGRVLVFLLRKKTKWNLTGIESNILALQVCRKWSDRTKIKTIEKNVFNYNISNYDIFFLGHPFNDNYLLQFIEKIENEIKQKVLVIIVLDISIGDNISKRKGWSIVKQEIIYKYYYLPILTKKNRFTIYSYSPNKHDNNKRSI